MRGLFITLLLCCGSFLVSQGQTHEVGAFVGLSGFTGDVGELSYFNPKNPAIGAIYRYSPHPRYALRGSVILTKLEGDDLDSGHISRNSRGYNFQNNIIEINANFEFNFLEFEPDDTEVHVTPYLGAGLAYFLMDYNYYNGTNPTAVSNQRNGDVALPFTLGVKSNVSPGFILGLELAGRYTFSDSIDGSGHKYNPFGNVNSNDWYFFYGLTATFTLGNNYKNCRCPF
ncbi:type IX secretion system protein PorG [Neptunitalea lumnitzerae]|uniref:DUF6089 domain-containing protein n=1 Tax=Neptunitalea lumnitzerae TaxID=2965509 RepID=A0ABQ5MML4_9FLAO|nr:DUF6089 family protein [Neptunitalea sp. Y10]GLB50648.1 hypothetical protein Y10_30160 [Neptunitalea sp. Y10]